MSMFSHAVSSLSRLGSWNTTPKRRRTSVAWVVGSSPSSSSAPLVGCRSVVSILMVVVFPAPFGPRKAKISPGCTSKETSFTAVTFPNDLTTCWTRMMGWSTSCLPFAPRPFLRCALLARAADDNLVPAGTLCLIHRRVTGEVAVRVVVLLELIDVRQQHRECAAQAARALHFARQRPHEVAAVIQPGEGIGE